jgi:alpha-D-ribose 1-methylphosphonate 5-triphosphate synthase subunit PhnH
MKLDPIHDIQQTFRLLTDSMAYAGKLVSVKNIIDKIDLEIPFLKSHLLLALLFLDAETTFAVITDDQDQCIKNANIISQLTYAQTAPQNEADYIFCMSSKLKYYSIVMEAKTGTLLDPHLGATIVIEQDLITSENLDHEQVCLELTGPGIKQNDKRHLYIKGDDSWQQARQEKNSEFPLGLECIIVDDEGRLSAIPRTTQITKGEN